MRTVPSVCIDLIKQFEGFSAVSYQDAEGSWTIGYGHTQGVTDDMGAITQSQAVNWLMQDISQAVSLIERLIYVPLNDNQFSALVSLVFNTGPAPLSKTLGTKLNAFDYQGAAQEFTRWVFCAGVENIGLMRRRLAEQKLFLTPAGSI